MNKPEHKIWITARRALYCIVYPFDKMGDYMLFAIDNSDLIIDFLLDKLWGLPSLVDVVAYPIEFMLNKTGDAILYVLRALVKPFARKPRYASLVLHFIRSINS